MFKKMTSFMLAALISFSLVQAVMGSVPFKGDGLGQITGGVPGVSLTGVATGNATHLGKYTRSETIVFGPNGSFTGDVTFTAANGDQLTANIAGAFTSMIAASGTYTFTGGTGRFENAAGLAYFSVALLEGGQFTVEFNGSFDN